MSSHVFLRSFLFYVQCLWFDLSYFIVPPHLPDLALIISIHLARSVRKASLTFTISISLFPLCVLCLMCASLNICIASLCVLFFMFCMHVCLGVYVFLMCNIILFLGCAARNWRMGWANISQYIISSGLYCRHSTNTHTHTRIHIYISIYIYRI